MIFSSLLKKIEYKVISGDADTCEVSSLCRDSRQKSPRGLFVCIKGARSDGHEFAVQAYANGCRAFLVERPIELPADACIAITSDTRTGLAAVSAEFYGNPSDELYVVGITGTKGKTTTALTAHHILNSCGMAAGYIGSNGVKYAKRSFETANTTPESCELQKYMRDMVDAGVKYLIMEVSSQAIYMNRVHGIKFDCVAFTNLYVDHIGGAEHPTFEHYRDCKKRLFTDYGAKRMICNTDDPYAPYMTENAKSSIISVSPAGNTNADIFASEIRNERSNDALSVAFNINKDGKKIPTIVPMPGDFSVSNALIALAICKEAGVPLSDAAKALSSASAEGRFQTVSTGTGALFIIDYAHNGASLSAALGTIRAYDPKRLVCLFGSVGGRTFGRRKELGEVAAALADFCILTSDNPDFEDPDNVINDIAKCFSEGTCPYVRIPDRREAIRFAVANAKAGDVILLAGKGHETYQIINGVREYFSESEIVHGTFDSICAK